MKRRSRQIFYVCSAINNNKLITESIPAINEGEAKSCFLKQHCVEVESLLGPFYKKRTVIKTEDINRTSIKFSKNSPMKAIFNNCLVNVFTLSNPENHACVIYLKRLDDNKSKLPKGTIIIPISDIKGKFL